MTEAVTVTLSPELVRKLDELKEKDASYEEILAHIVDEAYEDAWVTDEEKREILDALADVGAGNFYTHEEIKEMIDRKLALAVRMLSFSHRLRRSILRSWIRFQLLGCTRRSILCEQIRGAILVH